MKTKFTYLFLGLFWLYTSYLMAQPGDGISNAMASVQHGNVNNSYNEFEALYEKGLNCFKNDDAYNALTYFQKALAFSPNNHKVLFMIAESMVKNDKYSAAIPYYDKALYNLPNDAERDLKASYYSERGWCKYLIREYVNAQKDGDLSLALSADGNTYFLLGLCYYKLYNYEYALEYLQKAKNLTGKTIVTNMKDKVQNEYDKIQICIKKAENLAQKMRDGKIKELNHLKISFEAGSTLYKGLMILDNEGDGVLYIRYYDTKTKKYKIISQFVKKEVSDKSNYEFMFACYLPIDIQKKETASTYRADKLYIDSDYKVFNIDGQEVYPVTCTTLQEADLKSVYQEMGLLD